MTLASNLRENKAVYTVAGAGDFAVEKLREVPGQVDRYREQVRGTVDRYRGEVSRYQQRVDAKDLPGAAVAYATEPTAGRGDDLTRRAAATDRVVSALRIGKDGTVEALEPPPGAPWACAEATSPAARRSTAWWW